MAETGVQSETCDMAETGVQSETCDMAETGVQSETGAMVETGVQVEQIDANLPQSKPKRGRKRKKSLYKDIAQQMEVYFGDSNLLQDRFLNKEINASTDGFVPLSLFLKFNKIRKLGANTDDIAKAITHFSTLLKLNEDKDKVKRMKPLASQEEIDCRTVYVEGLPSTADHDWVKSILSKYGTINYVSLPKYASTKEIKGFAFVEFSSDEEAKACLGSIGTKEFSSVHPFPKAGSKDVQRKERSVGKITKLEPELPSLKKRNKKRSSASTDAVTSTTNAAKDSVPLGDTAAKDVSEVATEESPSDEPANKKAKTVATEPTVKVAKKRKRRSSQSKSKDEPAAKAADLDSETDTQSMKSSVKVDAKKSIIEPLATRKDTAKKDRNGPNLRAISKSEWMLLKKEYLVIQKRNMALLKEKIREQKAREKALEPSELSKPVEPVESSNKSLEDLQMIPNVVVQIKADNEIDRQKVKDLVLEDISVAYIDVRLGSSSGYIRCKSCEDASKLVRWPCEGYEMSLLQGDVERVYWDKLNQERLERRQNKTKTKRAVNKKGTKKVIDQLTKNSSKVKKNSHILFDDE